MAIENGKTYEANIPDFVAADMPQYLQNRLETLEKYALLAHSTEDIAKVCDCTEGLENAFKKAAETAAPLVDSLTSARYTSSRIRRIALHNLLCIDEALIRNSLASSLYLRVLAAKKGCGELLSALVQSSYPIIARAHDENALNGVAKACFERDICAEKVYNLLYDIKKDRNLFL